jgi:flagellar assembly factor FliW
MKCAEPNVAEATDRAKESVIRFRTGLLGFEQVKNYLLLADPQEAPFAWLQMTDEPRLSFLVVPPTLVLDNYHPDVSEEDVSALGLQSPEDALVLNIVTLHADGHATVNLKGPVIINRHTLAAKQVVPRNVADFPLQHPLNLAPA